MREIFVRDPDEIVASIQSKRRNPAILSLTRGQPRYR